MQKDFFDFLERFTLEPNQYTMRTVVTAILLALGMIAASAQESVPSYSVKDIDANELNIKDYTKDGTPKIISLWATWCAPCRTELKALKEIYPDWRDKYGVEIVAINVDSERMLKRAKALYDSNGWDYTFLHADQKQLMDALGITSIPYSILVDGNGNIRSTQNGYHPGYEKELEAKMRKL